MNCFGGPINLRVAVQAVGDDTAGSMLLDGVPVGHHVAVFGSTHLDACLAELMDESGEHIG